MSLKTWHLIAAVVVMIMVAAGGAVVVKQTRGVRNNNPGNIRYTSSQTWRGQIGSDGEFIKFDTMENGVRALAKLLTNYYEKYGTKSIAAIISRWAPPIENNTAAYIAVVSKRVGVSSSKEMDAAEFRRILPDLISAIAKHENGADVVTIAMAQRGMALA